LRAVVHVELCTGCGECVKSCPFGAIVRVLTEGATPFARVFESRCTGCAVCALECDKHAIELVCALTGERDPGSSV
jgi:heterodisulfide reductase subunit A